MARRVLIMACKLIAPRGDPIVLHAIHPNVGLTVLYQHRLDELISKMQCSIMFWIEQTYRNNPPRLAMDASPAVEFIRQMSTLGTRWMKQFNELSNELSKWFGQSVKQRVDMSFSQNLRAAGFEVPFTNSRIVQDVLAATIGQQVALIKSIGQEHLTDVQGMVLRSVQKGGDLKTLTDELEHRYNLTRKRAAFIASSQNRMSTAAITRVRQQEVGVNKAIWSHSQGAAQPRCDHVAFSAGRYKGDSPGPVYDVSKGAHLDDGWIWPGQLPNCFPGSAVVSLETGISRLWRTYFDGKMVNIQIGTDLLEGTVNHPILTSRGWVALGSLDSGDHVVCMVQQSGDMVDHDKHDGKTTFADLFETCSGIFGYSSRIGSGFNFHGDIPDNEVDEIIVINDMLPNKRDIIGDQHFGDFRFTESDGWNTFIGLGVIDEIVPSLRSGLVSSGLPLGDRHLRVLGSHTGRSISHQALLYQDISDVTGGVSWESQMRGYRSGTHTSGIERNDIVLPKSPLDTLINSDGIINKTNLFAQIVRIAANDLSNIFQFDTRFYEFRRVGDKTIRDYSGHIFTMETLSGYYSVSGASVQAKNCGCVSRGIIPGLKNKP